MCSALSAVLVISRFVAKYLYVKLAALSVLSSRRTNKRTFPIGVGERTCFRWMNVFGGSASQQATMTVILVLKPDVLAVKVNQSYEWSQPSSRHPQQKSMYLNDILYAKPVWCPRSISSDGRAKVILHEPALLVLHCWFRTPDYCSTGIILSDDRSPSGV